MSSREGWSGRAGFVLATIGSAVGIGSIWKFPYEVGANGGSAFLLFYLAGLVLVVVPLMLAEFAIGTSISNSPTADVAGRTYFFSHVVRTKERIFAASGT